MNEKDPMAVKCTGASGKSGQFEIETTVYAKISGQSLTNFSWIDFDAVWTQSVLYP